MARLAVSQQTRAVPLAVAAALLLTGLGLLSWQSAGSSWQHASTGAATAVRGGSIIDLNGSTPAPAVDPAAAAHTAGAPLVPERFLKPSKESYEKLQANPELLASAPELAAEFEAAPWLLPKRAALPYAGITDFFKLVEMRAQKVEGYSAGKAISVTYSNFEAAYDAEAVQNYVYGLVKFASASNYIVAFWTDNAREVCQDLNLPCADIRPLLVSHLVPAEKLVGHRITWVKPILTHELLAKGYAVHMSDSDVGYAAKPLWRSYMTLLHDPPADGCFQNEENGMGPINTGNYVVLPTPGAKSFVERWLDGLAEGIEKDFNDQVYIVGMMPRAEVFRICRNRQQCYRMLDEDKQEKRTSTLSMLRTYPAPYWAYSNHDFCAMDQPWAPSLDLCDWFILYLHAACPPGERKIKLLKDQNLWYMDADEAGRCQRMEGAPLPGAVVCKPLVWRLPKYELPITRCAADLALYHERPKDWNRRLRS
ncbi:hypothetical protein ABPG77_002469 [Micractinium sp. CCAP 211/92]